MGHGGARFAYGPGGLLRAAPDALLYECNSACACGAGRAAGEAAPDAERGEVLCG